MISTFTIKPGASYMMMCCSKYGSKRFGGLVRSEINSQAASPLSELSDDTEISRTQFEELLTKIDKGLRALPATAQVRALPLPLPPPPSPPSPLPSLGSQLLCKP